MAFRKKADYILTYNPDILIVPESESREKIDFDMHIKAPHQSIWVGNNNNKGLLACSYNKNIKIGINNTYNEDYKYILPLDVKFKGHDFLILAVWTQGAKNPYNGYIVQLYRAIKYYRELFTEKTIILGDWNSNAIWDNNKREASHTDVVNLLYHHEIESIYHNYNKINHGSEIDNTLYMFRKESRPYHVDYIFAGSYWLNKVANIEIGKYRDWSKYSDHMPIITGFKTL